MTRRWEPNERFLDYLLDCSERDLDKPRVGIGGQSCSRESLVENMRRGSRLGMRMYEKLYANGQTQEAFQKYLQRDPKE